MKKTFIKKVISISIISTIMVTALLPSKAFAEWKQTNDNTWYYLQNNQAVKGWKMISNTWYYFDSNGKMTTGWIYNNGYWYYTNNSGAMQIGWLNDNGKWYFLDSSGAMQTGSVKIDGKIYYLNELGDMKTGKMIIGYEMYTFNLDGQSVGNAPAYNKEFDSKGNVIKSTSATNTIIDIAGLPKLPKNCSVTVQSSAECKILDLMNQKRIKAGLKPLIMDSTLLKVSRYKSNHMLQYNYFSHTTPDGKNWSSWLNAIGYRCTKSGENIAYNTYNPVELFNQWWNSPGHKANMMNPSYTKVGIGIINGNGKYMGTQNFSN